PPSARIADHLSRQYGVAEPLVLYNVFPLSLAEGMIPPVERSENSKLRLHWFSQTIGPGRGLEDAMGAVALIEDGIELHLRGYADNDYLNKQISRHKLDGKVFNHAPTDHDDLIRAMSAFDVGLALERAENGNYSRT